MNHTAIAALFYDGRSVTDELSFVKSRLLSIPNFPIPKNLIFPPIYLKFEMVLFPNQKKSFKNSEWSKYMYVDL